MRKFFASLLVLVIILSAFVSNVKADGCCNIGLKIGSTTIVKDGSLCSIEAAPFLFNRNKTMVPVSFIADHVADFFYFDEAYREVKIYDQQENVLVVKDYLIDSSGCVFVPLRFVAQYFGFTVYWNEKDWSINLDYNNPTI